MDVLIRYQALVLVENLLSGQVMDDPQAIAQELGLTFDGEQDWHYAKLWAFTMRDKSNPMVGVTFYAPVGASRDEVNDLWNQKVAQFGGRSGINAA